MRQHSGGYKKGSERKLRVHHCIAFGCWSVFHRSIKVQFTLTISLCHLVHWICMQWTSNYCTAVTLTKVWIHRIAVELLLQYCGKSIDLVLQWRYCSERTQLETNTYSTHTCQLIYSVQFSLHCSTHDAHRPMHKKHCTMHTVIFTQRTAHCEDYSVWHRASVTYSTHTRAGWLTRVREWGCDAVNKFVKVRLAEKNNSNKPIQNRKNQTTESRTSKQISDLNGNRYIFHRASAIESIAVYQSNKPLQLYASHMKEKKNRIRTKKSESELGQNESDSNLGRGKSESIQIKFGGSEDCG